jgi:uncharacterized protein YndB with AHSA1/START domain
MERTHWPSGMEPAECPVRVRSERVIDAPPDRVFRWLVRADRWPEWFEGASAVRCSSGPEISDGATVRWRIMGASARADIKRLRPAELLEWEGGGMGVRAYHSWRLEPLGERTRVVSAETARGPAASLFRPLLHRIIERTHQRCLDGLTRAARSAPPPVDGATARDGAAASPDGAGAPADEASPPLAAAARGLGAHHVRFLARNLAAHRDPRNRLVHLVATVVGFCSLVSMLARVPLGSTNLGTLLALATVLYYAPFEPLAAALVGAAAATARLALGPQFGQAGVGPLAGIGVPLGVFLAFNLFGVYTHHLFDDPIIASGSTEKLHIRLLKTTHTILFSSVQFVAFGLFALGYRGTLWAEIERAAARQAELMGMSA